MMKTVSIWVACLGAFVLLEYSFSFWTAFGIIYFLGVLLVIIVAFLSRRRRQPTLENESAQE
jgi:Ca2+/Na+ antiporter